MTNVKKKKACDTKKKKEKKTSDTNSNANVSLVDEMMMEVYKKVYELHTVGGIPSIDMRFAASSSTFTRPVMLQQIAQYVCGKYGETEFFTMKKFYNSALRKSQNLRAMFVAKIEETVSSEGGIAWLKGVEPEDMALRLLDGDFIDAEYVRDCFQIIDFELPITHRHVQMVLLNIAMRIIWLRDEKTGVARKTEVGLLHKIVSFDSLGPQGSEGSKFGGLVHKVLGEKQDKIMKVIGEMLQEWEGSGQLVTENTSGDMQSGTSTTEGSRVSGTMVPSPGSKLDKKALIQGRPREKITPTNSRVGFISTLCNLYYVLFVVLFSLVICMFLSVPFSFGLYSFRCVYVVYACLLSAVECIAFCNTPIVAWT